MPTGHITAPIQVPTNKMKGDGMETTHCVIPNICYKHFPEGKPTEENTDPLPADKFASTQTRTPLRRPPKQRAEVGLTKRRRVQLEEISENIPPDTAEASTGSLQDV